MEAAGAGLCEGSKAELAWEQANTKVSALQSGLTDWRAAGRRARAAMRDVYAAMCGRLLGVRAIWETRLRALWA